MKDRKLFLVRSEAKAAEMRPHLPDNWMVKGISSALTGYRFSVIMVADQDERFKTPAEWCKYMQYLRTKLTPGGKLIEVY